MPDDNDADRSSIEIKTLTRKLHPDRGNHKDRIRAMNRFRNYVIGDSKSGSPEFYDDDMPLLFLGKAAPPALLEGLTIADDTLASLYGLMQACGTPSGEHGGTLKRSAKHAMQLLKWLLLDFKENSKMKEAAAEAKGSKTEANAAKKEELNQFAQAFLTLEAKYYSHMNLDMHLIGGSTKAEARGGDLESACHVVLLILTRHVTEDGEQPQPLLLEEVVAKPAAQQEFELWSAKHATVSAQDIIKKNAAIRQAELAQQQRQDQQNLLLNNAGRRAGDDYLLGDESDHGDDRGNKGSGDHDGGDHDGDNKNKDDSSSSDDDFFEDDGMDVMAAMRKRKKQFKKELKEAEGRGEISALHGGVATRWEDSQLAREQRARAAALARAGQQQQYHDTIRDSKDAAQDIMHREEQKAKVLGKDPLGIIKETEFDVLAFEKAQAEQMEQALHEAQEALQKAEATGNDKLIKKAALKKECLEGFIYRLGGIEAMENQASLQHSILPTNPKFNPVLFLTLVHRKTHYDTLIGSLSRLSNKTENHVEQLQNLVRDNFPLFVRCAEGFEQFRKSSQTEIAGLGVDERIDKLEAIAESCAFQAKKSFKPLLDNTSEVRKVQSAMSVLQRVAPILQVPSLMRQHIENRRYSQALKTYRRVLVVDKSCKIELLNHVKHQAEICVLEARQALEGRLAQDSASTDDLIAAIRDLSEELADLNVNSIGGGPGGLKDKKGRKGNIGGAFDKESQGYYTISSTVINVREHPPALACLLLQAAHFSSLVKRIVDETEATCKRIFAGESLDQVRLDDAGLVIGSGQSDMFSAVLADSKATRGSGNQWKYDVLDARVISTLKAVAFARIWLPRLIRVGRAAREDEKRRAARIGSRMGRGGQMFGGVGGPGGPFGAEDNHLTAFEVFISNISPSLTLLVEHASFCALGSSSRSSGKEVTMTFGLNLPDKLRALLRSPLPPSQSTQVGKEVADLVDLLTESSSGARALRPDRDSSLFQLSPLDECTQIGESAIVTIEKRRCMYAFDVCSRACSQKATGNGKFDAEALLNCLKKLAEQLSRPKECASEVEKGCELVVRRCCEGLANYVRDRGQGSRLLAVAECADVMADRVADVVREASFLTTNSEAIREVIMEDIMGLESAMFDEFLENIREDVANSVRVGWLDMDKASDDENAEMRPSFPPYLSASLLAIVRCRAQVEQALGDKVRRSEGVPYQHLAMSTVADGVVEGICNEIVVRKNSLKVRQADRLANELEFLKNVLKKFIVAGSNAKELLENTLHMVAMMAGRGGRGRQGDSHGPDGLAALEELERLGRVYVLCLGE